MSLELCILASGSAGNCAVLRTPAGVVMIDMGIGPRTVGKRLEGTGVSLSDVRSVCLTHLDYDHFRPSWLVSVLHHGIRVHCHADRRGELLARARAHFHQLRRRVDPALMAQLPSLVRTFDGEPFACIEGLMVRPLALAHDVRGSHGFLIEGFGRRIGYATDLGRVPARLIELFSDLDLLAIESNYDPDMQRNSGRPVMLQHRIMGGRGHLSNEQSLAAVKAILDRAQATGRLPGRIVLLHRSQQCNHPDLVLELFARDARIAPRLTLAEQSRRTEWLQAGSAVSSPIGQLPIVFA